MINDFKNIHTKFNIIDSHMLLGYIYYFNMVNDNDDKIIETLKTFGMKKAICSHLTSLSGEVTIGNNNLLKCIQKYRDFLYGLLVYNPNFPEESISSFKKYFKEANCVGIKMHPTMHLCYPTDEKYNKLWEFATELDMPILSHSWNPNVANKTQKFSDPFLFEEIVKKYPDIKIIFAHAAGRGDYQFKIIDLLDKYKNFYVDFSGDSFPPGLIKRYVDTLGSQRLLFGSDMPLIDIRFHISNILDAAITDFDRKNIFSINSHNLFGIKL